MAYWELTQQALQSPDNPLVAKPELTEKLLSKPPFRFLHDVISAVQNSTGFAAGLFNGQELDARAIQDKEGKVAYLSKIMAVVGMVLNQPVPANPLKVVAGLEAENTNTFLQMLGAAAKLGPATDAVQVVLAQYPPAIGAGSTPAAAAPEPPPPQQPPQQQQQQQPFQQQQQMAEPPPPPQQPQQAPRRTADLDERPSSRGVSRQPAPAPSPAAAAPPAPAAPGRPQSAKKAPPKAATPEGAAAPRPGARPAGGGILGDKPGAAGGGGGAAKPITIIEEGRGAKAGGKAGLGELDDEDDVPVVVAAAAGAGGGRGGMKGGGGQGVLVQDIMAAQQQVKAAGGEDAAEGDDDGGDGTGIILKRTAKPAGGGAGAGPKDVTALRDTVQELCQCALPLSRSVEHLQEDLDSLAKEYKFWLTERRMYQARLAEEQQAALDLSSLEARLADKEGACREARGRLAALKAAVLREDEAIMKLLGMVLSAG